MELNKKKSLLKASKPSGYVLAKYVKCCVWFVVLQFIVLSTLTAQTPVSKVIDSVKTIPDTLLFRIQTAQSAITEINAANKKGYNLDAVKQRIADIHNDIDPLKRAFDAKGEEVETKSLLSYELILKDAEAKLKAITAELVKSSNALQAMNEKILKLSGDSLLKDSADKQHKELYLTQLGEIRQRLQDAGKLNGNNLSEINKMLASVSALNIVVNNLSAQTAERLEQSGKLALSKKDPYIWQAALSHHKTEPVGNMILASYLGQHQILKYFINSTWDNRFLAIIIAVAFFIWVQRNFRTSRRARIRRKLGTISFEYLKPLPVLATLIVLLNITPLFEPDSPSLYVELIQLLLLIVMTIHLWKVLDQKQLRFWLWVGILYLLLILGNAAVDQALPLRLVLIGINVFFIYLGSRLYNRVAFRDFSKKYVRIVIVVLVVMNVFSILLNVFGRVDLAKMASTTGVIGLIQLIGLAVFMQIILDAFELQMRISSCNNGLFSRIDHNRSRAKLKKGLSILCVILWLMVLLINLNLIGGTWQLLSAVLSRPRTFGSIHFTLGNILFFVAIVFIANKLQKHVPLLFGEEKITFTEASGHKGSKVALVRLVIIVLGVLLAFMASGLPMDRLTVVLGALGVGIGLGMQNIVNNFVSGIILIFEKPFRIGDYVELADKKGKVRDIGIRSSKLLTPLGAEVIIPNGDLLSGRLVNWTLSNDYIKTELVFKVPADTSFEQVTSLINDVLQGAENAVKQLPPEVLLNAITADALEIKVLAWISNIYVEAEFKSTFLMTLLEKLRAAEIKMM